MHGRDVFSRIALAACSQKYEPIFPESFSGCKSFCIKAMVLIKYKSIDDRKTKTKITEFTLGSLAD